MTGRLDGKVAVVTGGCSGIGLATVRRFLEEGAQVVVGDVDDARGQDARSAKPGVTYVHVDVTDEGRGRRAVQDRARHLRLGRHRLQQRRHLPAGGRLDPRHRPRRVAPGAGGQPHQRLPLLQGGAAVHARAGQGLDHQHRVVRRGDGRGDVADLLLRLQGRRAVDDPRARRAVRPRGRARQRAVPGAGEHAAAAGAVRQGRRSAPRAGSCTCRWAASASPRRWPTRCCSWPPTSRRSSPPRRSSSTAASPAPTSPRCDPSP